jgi:iron complex transport system permease protein
VRASAAEIRFTPARATAVVGGLLLLLVVAFALSLALGEFPLSLTRALTDSGSPDGQVLYGLRLPRALLGALVGASLAAAGSALQALLRNPLADPFVLGVSGGAALGATVAIVAGASTLVSAVWLSVAAPSAAAFVGAIFATLFVFASGRKEGRLSPYAALLSGVIFNTFAVASITFVRTLTSPQKAGELTVWLAGALGYERYGAIAAEAVLQAIALGVLFIECARLNLLSLGDEHAHALGVPVERTRLTILLAASLSVAGAVALSGLIAFVGLIVPHVLRLWLGPDQRLLLPASAVGGAAFLVLADLLTRLLFSVFHAEPPVGVVTAVLGGPLFLWLLQRRAPEVV